MKKLDNFFQLHPVAEREAVEITMLHLEGGENCWWFSHIKHARLFSYAKLNQRLIKNFDRRKPEVISIETFPNIDEIAHEEQREDVSTITL